MNAVSAATMLDDLLDYDRETNRRVLTKREADFLANLLEKDSIMPRQVPKLKRLWHRVFG